MDVATTGGDAHEVAHRRRPSIVLLDIGLPDFSGLDVLKLVRQPGHPDHGNTGFEDRGRSGGERRLRLHSQARQRRLRREPRRGGAPGSLATAAQLRPARRWSRRGR
ncbi:MAG: hypothetical protein DME09_08845 [Candidatus Rokuibacteriota bacterium]|nr:MAG: hypothetical protein DME09_08845 [Candidatus Rokubacteria bacterium]